MGLNLAILEAYGELVPGRARCSHTVHEELLAMSAARIDPYLAVACTQSTHRAA